MCSEIYLKQSNFIITSPSSMPIVYPIAPYLKIHLPMIMNIINPLIAVAKQNLKISVISFRP